VLQDMSYLKLLSTLSWRLSFRLNRAMMVHLQVSYLKLSTLVPHQSSRLNRAMLVDLEVSYLKLPTTLQHQLSRLNRALLVHLEVFYLNRSTTLPWHQSSRLNRGTTVHWEVLSLCHRLMTLTREKVKLYVLLPIITPRQGGSCKLAIGITKLET